MFARGGVRPFFVGIGATVSRDIIFGGTYAFLRHDIYSRYFPVAIIITNDPAVTALEKGESLKTIGPSSNHQDQSDVIVLTSHQERRIRFVINLFSACVATIISSPLNYIRNMHYATPPDTAPHSMHKTLSHLATEVSKKSSLRDRVVFMMARLTIGWGTARVALGMAFGSEFYYYCSQPHS